MSKRALEVTEELESQEHEGSPPSAKRARHDEHEGRLYSTLQHKGKSKTKGRKRKRTIPAKKCTSEIPEKRKQKLANKQNEITILIQEFGRLTLEQPPNEVMENTMKTAAEKKEVRLPEPSMDTSDCRGIVSQPVQQAFCSNSVNPAQYVQQTIRQPKSKPKRTPHAQQQEPGYSFGGKGAGVKPLDIPQELIQRWSQTKTAETVACKQKAKVTDNPIAQDTTCRIDISGSAEDCMERDNGPVRNRTKDALRLKLQPYGKSGKKGKNGKSLNSGKTVSAKESVSEMLGLEEGIESKQIPMTLIYKREALNLGHRPKPVMENNINYAVTERKAPVAQSSMDTPDFPSQVSQQMMPTNNLFGTPVKGIAEDCMERDNGPVKNRTKDALRLKLQPYGKSGKKGKNGKSLNSGKTVSAKESVSEMLGLEEGIESKQIPMTLIYKLEALNLGHRPKPVMENNINYAVTERKAPVAQSSMDTPDFPSQVSQQMMPTNNLFGTPVKGIAEDCMERDNGPVKNRTKDALRLKLQPYGKSGKKGKNGKSLNSGKTVSAKESVSEMLGLEEGIESKQIPMTLIYKLEALNLGHRPKPVMENNINYAVTERKAPVAQSSMDTPGFPSQVSQPMMSTISFNSVNPQQIASLPCTLSGINTSQPLQQARQQPENNVVSLGGKGISQTGAGVMRLDIPQELTRRSLMTKAAEQANKVQPKVFSQTPTAPREQAVKIGQTRNVATCEDFPLPMEVDDDAGDDGNLPK